MMKHQDIKDASLIQRYSFLDHSQDRKIWTGPRFSIWENGKWSWIEMKSFTTGVFLPRDTDGRIYLVKILRHATCSESLEIPRGGGEVGETTLIASIREAEEETGYPVIKDSVEHIGKIAPDSGVIRREMDIFTGLIDTSVPASQPDPDEVEVVSSYSPADIIKMISAGKITDSFTLSALMLYLCRKNVIPTNW